MSLFLDRFQTASGVEIDEAKENVEEWRRVDSSDEKVAGDNKAVKGNEVMKGDDVETEADEDEDLSHNPEYELVDASSDAMQVDNEEVNVAENNVDEVIPIDSEDDIKPIRTRKANGRVVIINSDGDDSDGDDVEITGHRPARPPRQRPVLKKPENDMFIGAWHIALQDYVEDLYCKYSSCLLKAKFADVPHRLPLRPFLHRGRC